MNAYNAIRKFGLNKSLQHSGPSLRSHLHTMAGAEERSNTIGFIGLGSMGNHMLNNLIKRSMVNGDNVRTSFAVYDVNGKAVDEVTQRHEVEHPTVSLFKCKSPADVAKRSSTIISMVPTGAHVRDVYLGSNGVMSALKTLEDGQAAATLCLDQSTIEQEVSKEVAMKMREIGADMMDAPVSGGTVGARDGTLAIMVGGSRSSFDRARPVLQMMANRVTLCGDLGAGLAAKIANNMLLGITMLGLSEAMLLGKTLGVEPQVLAEIINTSTGRCWSSEVNQPVPEVKVGTSDPPAHRNYEGGFVTKLTHKDLGLAVAAAEEVGAPLELGKHVEEVYRSLAKSEKWANRDFSVVYQALSERIVPRL